MWGTDKYVPNSPPLLCAVVDIDSTGTSVIHTQHLVCLERMQTPTWVVVPMHLTCLPSRGLYQLVNTLQMKVPTSACVLREHLSHRSKCLVFFFPASICFSPGVVFFFFFFICSAALILGGFKKSQWFAVCLVLVVKVEAIISLGLSITEVKSEVFDSTLLQLYFILSQCTKVPL